MPIVLVEKQGDGPQGPSRLDWIDLRALVQLLEAVTEDVVALLRLHPLGNLGAGLLGVGTAGAEAAARGGIGGAGDVALQKDAVPPAEIAHLGRGGEERLGIGVQGVVEDGLGVAQLHHLTQVHDGHPVAQVLHHAQVVADEEVGEAQLFLQLPQEVQNLGPDRHVQGGDRLVTDDELGLSSQSPGDDDALALAAGELMGVAVHVGLVEAHHLQELLDPGLPLAGAGVEPPDAHGLLNDLPHGHAGVQGAVGVLKDDLHVLAQGAQLMLVLSHEVGSVKGDGAAGGLNEPQHRTGEGGLAAARLPDEPQRLPLVEAEAHVVDGLDIALLLKEPAFDGEPLAHVVRLKQDLAGGVFSHYLATSS